jgi:hypothetical protein
MRHEAVFERRVPSTVTTAGMEKHSFFKESLFVFRDTKKKKKRKIQSRTILHNLFNGAVTLNNAQQSFSVTMLCAILPGLVCLLRIFGEKERRRNIHAEMGKIKQCHPPPPLLSLLKLIPSDGARSNRKRRDHCGREG